MHFSTITAASIAITSSAYVQPDGHCMYRAVQDQLSLHSDGHSHPATDVTELRKKTADYIRQHRDDFLPFLTQVGNHVALVGASLDLAGMFCLSLLDSMALPRPYIYAQERQGSGQLLGLFADKTKYSERHPCPCVCPV